MTVFEKIKKDALWVNKGESESWKNGLASFKSKDYAKDVFKIKGLRCQSCKHLNTKKCSEKMKIGTVENCIEGIELFLNSEATE